MKATLVRTKLKLKLPDVNIGSVDSGKADKEYKKLRAGKWAQLVKCL